jgi:ABC-type spermidine/putrescine transport system permease subunit II
MQLSGPSKWLLRLGTALTLAFLYIPLLIITIYAFNSTRMQK